MTTAPVNLTKVRPIASWLLRHPDELDAEEHLQRKQVLAACPHLEATATHVAAFAEMLTGRHGDRLDGWMTAVEAADLPQLHRFITGLRRDSFPASPATTSASTPTGEYATATSLTRPLRQPAKAGIN